MREEELQNRLQRAFPNSAPPDAALHSRIQRLSAGNNRQSRRGVIWRRVIGGTVLTGISAMIATRLAVGYVLQKMSLAEAPRTIHIKTQDYNSNGEEFLRLYWITGERQRTVTYAPEKLYGKSFISNRVTQNGIAMVWRSQERSGVRYPSVGTIGANKLTNFSDIPWEQLMWRGPWVVRLPDRTFHGRRQWVLQQIQAPQPQSPRTPTPTTPFRKVWGVDAQTGRVSWRELWACPNDAIWQLKQRTDYSYGQPLSESLFEVPSNRTFTLVREPRSNFVEPAFSPYLPESDAPPGAFIVQWWRGVLGR